MSQQTVMDDRSTKEVRKLSTHRSLLSKYCGPVPAVGGSVALNDVKNASHILLLLG